MSLYIEQVQKQQKYQTTKDVSNQTYKWLIYYVISFVLIIDNYQFWFKLKNYFYFVVEYRF